MKNLEECLKYDKRGITLIALVVTIIVLLILAGITISMLFGENGLLNKATDATEEYNKSEVKEKVELLLSEYVIDKATGENNNFANFLRKNLQVGVAENDDNTYSFMLGEWQVITDENKVISIEKFKLDVDRTYPNVASMKEDTSLTEGKLVQTESYWDKQYAGSAYYDIVSSTNLSVDDGKCIQLDNGLYAELHPINDTVTVNQFGAYGDGEHNDAESIQIALNSGYENVRFEKEEYKINTSVTLSTNEISILGNASTLFTTNDFTDSKEHLVIIQANDINIYNLNIVAKETVAVGYKTQLGIIKASNIEIYNCSFTVPETTPSQTTDGGKKEYTNIDLYSGWHNVSIENCNLQVLHDGEAGGCIWIRDLLNLGCDSLKFNNNNCYKICHDEILAAWGQIDNVEITNNNFRMEEKEASSSVKCISFGDEENILTNVTFSNNKLDCISSMELIGVTGNSTDINIYGNNINYIQSNIDSDVFIVNAETEIKSFNNNIIEFSTLNTEGEAHLIMGVNNVNNNQIRINTSPNVDSIFGACNNIENNSVYSSTNVNITNLFNACYNIKNNELVIDGKISQMFQFFSTEVLNDVNIYNNSITYNYEESVDGSTILMINNAKLNGHIIKFENNKIQTKKIANNSRLMFLILTDSDSQTIEIKQNMLGGYSSIYRTDNGLHNVQLNNNSN